MTTIRSHTLNRGHRFEECFVCGECQGCHAAHDPMPRWLLPLCIAIVVIACAAGWLSAQWGWVR